MSLSAIFLIYTGTSIAEIFFISAAMFGIMSLLGYITRRDLSKFGSFLVMGLIGVIIASVVNIFLRSAAFQFPNSISGVVVLVGLTAWDSQRIRAIYLASDDPVIAGTEVSNGSVGPLSRFPEHSFASFAVNRQAAPSAQIRHLIQIMAAR